MKCITLWRPWGMWIAHELKRVETRGHDRFRSLVGRRIAIHEGRLYDETAVETAVRVLRAHEKPERVPNLAGELVGIAADSRRSRGGFIVCTAVVSRHRRLGEKDALAALCPYVRGSFGIVLKDVRRLEKPVPCKGHQGIWTVPAGVIPAYARCGAPAEPREVERSLRRC